MQMFEAIMLSVIAASTPLLLAAAGELVTERSGVLNLGLEGMMIMGAACAFAGTYVSGSVVVGALCGVLAGVAMSAIFAIFTLGLAVNQVASGLALTILGTGLSGLIGAAIASTGPDRSAAVRPNPVRSGRVRLFVRRAGDRHLAFSLSQPRRPRAARRGRQPYFGPCAGLSGAQDTRACRAVRRRLRRARRCLSAARLHTVLYSGHDRGAGLDRAGPGGVRLVAPRPFGGRRLSVRRGLHPATPRSGARPRHSFAVDVVAALSCHGHRSRVDFTYARHFRVCRASISRCGLRAGPLIVSRTRATGASHVREF